MTASQYRAALAALGLTIVGAASLIGLSRRQSQRIACGACHVPPPVAKLLDAALNHGINLERLK